MTHPVPAEQLLALAHVGLPQPPPTVDLLDAPLDLGSGFQQRCHVLVLLHVAGGQAVQRIRLLLEAEAP